MFNDMKIGPKILTVFAFVDWKRTTGGTPVPDETATVSFLSVENLIMTEARAVVSADESGSFMA